MNASERLNLIENLMLKLWGIPYRWGGDDPINGFDCSGGVLEILKSVGLWPSHEDATAQSLYNYFGKEPNGHAVPTDDVTFGDLVFYGKATDAITHVGMAFNDLIMFEFGGGDSTTTGAAVAAIQNAYGRFRPINHRKDLVAAVEIKGLTP